MTIFLSFSPMLHDNTGVDTIGFIFCPYSKKYTGSFIQCRKLPIKYNLIKEEVDTLKKIMSSTPKRKVNPIYLGLKYPYRTRYYFKMNNDYYFSVEENTDKSFSIIIIDTSLRNAFFWKSVDSKNNETIKILLDRIDKLE